MSAETANASYCDLVRKNFSESEAVNLRHMAAMPMGKMGACRSGAHRNRQTQTHGLVEQRGISKSDVVREALAQYLSQSQAVRQASVLELAGDLVGCVKGAPKICRRTPATSPILASESAIYRRYRAAGGAL